MTRTQASDTVIEQIGDGDNRSVAGGELSNVVEPGRVPTGVWGVLTVALTRTRYLQCPMRGQQVLLKVLFGNAKIRGRGKPQPP